MEGGIERIVSRLIIENYKKLLENETDETKRQTLMRLLAEEQAKLRGLAEATARKRQA